METYIYSDSLFNTLYSEIKHKFLKKISFGQNKRHDKAFFFLSELQLITILLLICNSYTSWSTRFISLNCMQGFLFSISSRFYWSLYFFSTKSTDNLFKASQSFQNKHNRKATHSLVPIPLIFKLQQDVLKFNDICVSWSSPKTDLVTNFLIPENRSFEKVSILTFK